MINGLLSEIMSFEILISELIGSYVLFTSIIRNMRIYFACYVIFIDIIIFVCGLMSDIIHVHVLLRRWECYVNSYLLLCYIIEYIYIGITGKKR